MTDRERIEKMRETARLLTEEADRIEETIDPPRPETLVWWRWHHKPDWHIGEVSRCGKGIVSWDDHVVPWRAIDWKPAHILGPGQVVVPKDLAENAWLAMSQCDMRGSAIEMRSILLFANSEAMEAEHGEF